MNVKNSQNLQFDGDSGLSNKNANGNYPFYSPDNSYLPLYGQETYELNKSTATWIIKTTNNKKKVGDGSLDPNSRGDPVELDDEGIYFENAFINEHRQSENATDHSGKTSYL